MTPQELRQRLLPEHAVDVRRIDLGGVDTYVLEAGAGPPMIVLHGGIESGGAYWGPVIPYLAEHHRVIVPDVPGLGETPPGALEPWYQALLTAAGPEPPVLLAHSLLGSFVAQKSGLLRQLVLVSAPGVGPYQMPLGLLAAAILLDLRPSERSLMRFARWPFHDLERARRRDPEWFDRFFAYTLACTRVPATKRTMRRLIRRYTKQIPLADLRAIAVPTALLWGEYDRMVPVRVGQAAAAELGWPLRILPDVGHVPNLEDPAGFAAAVDDIVKGVDSA